MTGWGKVSPSIRVRAALFCLPLILAGCGAPPAFIIATLAIDAASVASTGKTPAGHALSAVVQQDCAVLHLVTDGDLCAPVAVIADDLDKTAQEAAVDQYGIDLLAYN